MKLSQFVRKGSLYVYHSSNSLLNIFNRFLWFNSLKFLKCNILMCLINFESNISKNRKNHLGGKVWCKVRKRKCEPGFTRVWAQGPRYLLQDDVQAKVVKITMVALTRQDSGKYWCMRNSSGILYPLMGFQLQVSPGEQACWDTGKVGVPSVPCAPLTSDTVRIIIHEWAYCTVGFS